MRKTDADDLRAQYQQNMENYRHEDRNMWQVPPIVIAISGGIIGVAFGYLKHNILASSILLAIGGLLSFAMFVVLRKIKLSQYRTIDKIHEIEASLGLGNSPIKPLSHEDPEYEALIQEKNRFERWILHRSAANWLSYTPLGILFCFVILFILNFVLRD